MVPSVCWCPDFGIVHVQSTREMSRVDVPFSGTGVRVLCPTWPVYRLADGEGRRRRKGGQLPFRDRTLPPAACEAVGLTRDADVEEMVAKYGSTTAARLRVTFLEK